MDQPFNQKQICLPIPPKTARCLATYNLGICFQSSFAAVSINRWNYQSNKCQPHANEVCSAYCVCTNNVIYVCGGLEAMISKMCIHLCWEQQLKQRDSLSICSLRSEKLQDNKTCSVKPFVQFDLPPIKVNYNLLAMYSSPHRKPGGWTVQNESICGLVQQ